MSQIRVVGLDLAKQVFQVHAIAAKVRPPPSLPAKIAFFLTMVWGLMGSSIP